MKLSVVVIAFNIPREIRRTLISLSAAFQLDIHRSDYEVIVVDNGSAPPLDPSHYDDLDGNFKFLRIDEASPSPAKAINAGLKLSMGDCIGVMIDGARMASPRLLSLAIHGVQLFPGGVTGALGWYLGFDYQRNAAQVGYDQAAEDDLLDTVNWLRDGYELFKVATPDESSMDGWFAPIAELNAVFMHRDKWQRLEGFDEKFDAPGGGLVNLDLYCRAIEEPSTDLVLLLGEATFHQFHQGVATNSPPAKALDDWETWEAQYATIRGRRYTVPRLARPATFLGCVQPQMRGQFARAVVLPAPDRHTGKDAFASVNALENLLLPLEAVDDDRLNQALQLVRRNIRLSRYAVVAALCRQIRRHYPSDPATLRLLSMVAPWVPHAGRYSSSQEADIGPASREMDKILLGSASVQPGEFNPNTESFGDSPPKTSFHSDSSWLRDFPFIESTFIEPQFMSFSAPWAGHIPFASWLIRIAQPSIFVELGSFIGVSYLAFCQAIASSGAHRTRAFAVDTWEGDGHTGPYDESIFETLRRNHDPLYADFSSLLRMTFDAALSRFDDACIDLLHIDGFHTYTAVRHDFETWLPKMSHRGIVLFHDIAVRRDDFGVHQFWLEVCDRYPSFSFEHSHGLGVLLVGTEQPEELLSLCKTTSASAGNRKLVKQLFSGLGARLEKQAEVLALEQHLKDSKEEIADLTSAGRLRHDWILKLDDKLLQKTREASSLEKALKEHQGLLSDSEALLIQRTAYIDRILNSRSWKITAPLRWGISKARQIRNGLRYVRRGQWSALRERMRSRARDSSALLQLSQTAGSDKRVGILTPPHTLFFAHAIERALCRAGFEVEILSEPPSQGYSLSLYLVICPQVFKKLPPGERRIAVQMEQTVSERWFTRDYLDVLEHSLAVFDYAQFNLRSLERMGIRYPHTYFVPVGGITNYPEAALSADRTNMAPDRRFDVLFYGDASAPRRRQLLDAVGRHFSLRVESNLFGAELHEAIASAKVVLNIHYYEGALIESTRLFESLSLGAMIVSEKGADQAEYEHLEDCVRFFPVGDIEAMLHAISDAIERPREPASLATAVARSEAHFQFMLYRALQGLHLLGPGHFRNLVANYQLPGNRLVLSLPETTLRRSLYSSIKPENVEVFDGLRRSPGWMGCALSYQFMAQKAMDQKFPHLDVMEDDVLLPADYEAKLAIVTSYLQAHEGQWDIFAGLITVLHPDVQVLKVDIVDGLTLVTLNRLTGTVFNRYAPSALRMLSKWDSNNTDSSVNTIDKYLESQPHLRVVTTLPYLAGHREDANSSLWGFSNTQYLSLIANSEKEIYRLVENYLQSAKDEATI
ncbi:MAG: class I SAM-dependent methyltransferase [Ramlibacter sp.]|nr:class I SAM-dependent methyltransferase [Ramlibacter sp.]